MCCISLSCLFSLLQIVIVSVCFLVVHNLGTFEKCSQFGFVWGFFSLESGFEFWSGMSQCCYILTVACHREILIHMARLFSLASPSPYMMSHLQGLPMWLGFSQHGGIRIVILLNWLVSGCPETGSESCESPKTWIQKLLQRHFGHI